MFGKRINLQEIELIVRDEFDLRDIAVAGVDDHLKIFVTVEGLDRQIRSFLHRKIDLHSSAVEVRTIDKIPRNSAGKVLYAELENF